MALESANAISHRFLPNRMFAFVWNFAPAGPLIFVRNSKGVHT